MLEEVHTYLITYGTSLGELAQATVSVGQTTGGQNHHTTSTASTHGHSHDKPSHHHRKGGKSKSTNSSSSLSRSYSNNAMIMDPQDGRTTPTGNGNLWMDGQGVTMALSDHDWEICSRIWPYFTSPSSSSSSSTNNNTSTKSTHSTTKTSNEFGEPMNKQIPSDSHKKVDPISIQGTTCMPLHEIVWREGLIEEDVMKMIRKLPQFFAVYYC